MFIKFDDSSVRYTGRFGVIKEWNHSYIAATACGAMFELAYKGSECVLCFSTELSCDPMGHIYISVDGGADTEATIEPFLHIEAADGEHIVRVIFKSAVEAQPRWHLPLCGKLAFNGYEADAAGVLPPDERKTIEFVGDSITEGVLIDASRHVNTIAQNGSFQDDVTGTYAWLTAKALNLRPFMMGYGAVGITKGGSGAVPKVSLSYPYNFEGSPVTYSPCDYIVINHGANDGSSKVEDYTAGYADLLDIIRARCPDSKIIILSPFFGGFEKVLPDFTEKYNREHNLAGKSEIAYISTLDWVPREPLHPLRPGHRIIANHLVLELKKIIG